MNALSIDSYMKWIECCDVLMFLRLFLVFGFFKFYTEINTYKGRMVCSLSRITITDKFLLRVWLNKNPAETLLLTAVFLTFVSSYSLFVFER